MRTLALTAILTALVSAAAMAKPGQTLKLAGHFKDVRVANGVVTFVFTGRLLDSSHPEQRSGFPIWDFPIEVTNLTVTATDTVCMDHRIRRNFGFRDQPSESLDCLSRIEELVAAVPISGIRFSGAESKRLETKGLHFYGMEQVRQ